MAPRDDDEDEEDRLEDEVVAGEDERARPQVLMRPEPRDPLADLRAQRRRVALARLLERRAHPSSDTIEKTYEIASARKGSERPRPKSAPPSGGPASVTTEKRACSAAAASGSCRGSDD